jgi:hypothetical protein
MSAVVQVIFDDVNKARAFMRWLDNSGELRYFKELEDTCKESVANFEYDYAHLRILTEGDLCNKE